MNELANPTEAVGYADECVRGGFAVLARFAPQAHDSFIAAKLNSARRRAIACVLTAEDLDAAMTLADSSATAETAEVAAVTATCRVARRDARAAQNAKHATVDAQRAATALADFGYAAAQTDGLADLGVHLDAGELDGLCLPARVQRILRAAAPAVEAKLSAADNGWTMRGMVSADGRVVGLDGDTKVLSKLLEAQVGELLADTLALCGLHVEEPTVQNCYPDLTVHDYETNERVAVDVKTTYRIAPGKVQGFTLGAYSGYFRDRESTKNTLYPYGSYGEHFVVGVIYDRERPVHERSYTLEDVATIPAVASAIEVIAQPKWALAAVTAGSGNTKNIGSMKSLEDLRLGNSAFVQDALAHDECPSALFDAYWQGFGDGYRTLEGYRAKLAAGVRAAARALAKASA